MLTKTQQKLFEASYNTINAHLSAYGLRISKQEKPYAQIVISGNGDNQLILRAVGGEQNA